MAKKIIETTRRVVQDKDLDLAEQNLVTIKIQADKINQYLSEHDWTTVDDPVARKNEFALQAELTDKLVMWNRAYMEGSGIIEAFERKTKVTGKLRGDTVPTGIDSVLKEKYKIKHDDVMNPC